MNATRGFLNSLGLFTQASKAIQERGADYWRERIYNYMLSTMVLLGLLAVIPSVWLSFAEGLIGLAIFDIVAYLFVVALLYARRVNYQIRATIFLLLGQTVGLVVLLITGDEGAGFFWMFAVPPLASLLLGLRAGSFFYALNVLIVVAIGFVVANNAPLFPRLIEFSIESWVVYGVNFLITNALVTLPLGLLLNGLFHSTEQAQKRLADLRSLYAIDQAIIGSLDLQTTLSAVLRETRKQLEVDAVAIWLNDEQGWLDYSHGVGFEEVEHGEGKIKDQVGVAKPQGLDWLHMDRVFETKFGAPMRSKKGMIGILEAYEKKGITRDRGWFDTLQAIAGQASIAIQNARLFEETSRARLKAEQDANFFRLLFNNHPVPMWIYDLETLAFLEVNDAAVANYGFTREEFLSITIKDIRPAEDIEKLIRDVKQERSDLQHSEGWRHRLKNGMIIDVEINSHILEFMGRKAALVMAEDVSERKKYEAQLRLSDQILKHVKTLVIVIDANQEVIYASPSVEEVIGYTSKEVMGDGWWHLSRKDPTSAQKEREGLRRAMLGEAPFTDTPYERPLQDRSGVTHWIEWQDVLGPNGTLIGVGHEVTERKKMETEIRESEARTRLVVDNSLDAIITMDAGGIITGWNPQAEKTFGWSVQEAVGHLMSELIIPSQYRAAHKRGLRHFLETGEGPVLNRRIEISALHRDGYEFPVELTISPVKAENVVTFSGFVRDITERKQAAEKVRAQLNQLKALGEIDRAILSTFDLHLNLQTLLKRVVTELKVDAVNIMIFHPLLQTLESVSGFGFRTKAFERREIRLGEGNAGRAALERHMVRIDDLGAQTDNPRLARALVGEGFITYFGVPLIAKGQVRGVIEIFHRAPLQPDEDWLELLNALAGRAAIAIDTVKVFENLQNANAELTLSYTAAIEGWSHALDLRDHETEGHSQRVTELALRLAKKMGLSSDDLVHFRRGALLHDIGKMGIPDSILLKPAKLTEDEWKLMKQHPVHAHNMLRSITYLRQALDIPFSHHEKWDGTGYPEGLQGEEIPLAARIFSVADVYDALTSDRPYRKAWARQKAIDYIKEQSGKQFDPQAVDAFMKINLAEEASFQPVVA
ncbi:MAG: PAS domain S-box protein [Anaerolineales bacterium]